jgi:hypothetical protein
MAFRLLKPHTINMHYIVYIHGLGDNTKGQEVALQLWHLWGVKTTLVPMQWADKQPLGPKLARLLQTIDALAAKGHTVSLLAASAGASAALTVFAQRKETIHKVALLCGEVNPSAVIAPRYRNNNPAFTEAMDGLESSLALLGSRERKRIRSYRALRDGVVPAGDTNIDGAQHKVMPVLGHAIGIGFGLTLGSYGIARWIKR